MSFKMVGLCGTKLQILTKLSSAPKYNEIQKVIHRDRSHLIPPSQYDMPFPIKFRPSYALKTYLELIPLVVVCAVAIFGVIFNVIWACKNKVDVVFSSHSRDNISRTMDLRHPTVHKLIIIHQRYEPWPEMAHSLEAMREAEQRELRAVNTVCQN